MSKGQIVYLNGVTSSGKTSIVEALRRRGVDFYYLADDLFEDHIMDVEYEDPEYWDKLAEAVFLEYRVARLFSDHGKTVVIDSMLMEKGAFVPHYARMLEIFAGYPLDIVEVYCPLEVCRQRNLRREDRHEMQSLEQAAVMAKDVAYGLRLDTQKLSADECAARIIEKLRMK